MTNIAAITRRWQVAMILPKRQSKVSAIAKKLMTPNAKFSLSGHFRGRLWNARPL